MKKVRWLPIVFAFLAAGAADAPAQAQFPAKPIRIVVPYAPGGFTDVVARLYAEQLRKAFGQAVVVENKPGASGIIAIEEMARAKPDGHTLMVGNISTNGLTPVLNAKKMTIDYGKDVAIVARLADAPAFFLATTTNFPPKTFAEFLQYARQNPGKVRFGSAGTGSYQQVNTAILAKAAGLDLVHIPFKEGGAPLLKDLANGDVQVTFFNITNPVGMMKAGRVRPLALSAAARLADYPDVPTFAELGFDGVKAAQWVAAFAPSATPAEVIETLHGAFAKAADVAEMQEAFRKGGMVPPPKGTLADAGAWVEQEMAMWKRVVDELGIVVEDF
jgi:tripartite-type tricarboxylate transporter receptor subunit TctC